MIRLLKALSFTLLLSSPFSMGLPAFAQEGNLVPGKVMLSLDDRPAGRVESFTVLAGTENWMWPDKVDQAEWDAYASGPYGYWDASVLAEFWDSNIEQAKGRIGRKLKWGPSDQAVLDQMLLDARVQALESVEELRFFSASGYSYNDAQALADFWGEESPYEAKQRIERNLIMGNYNVVSEALKLANGR